jgi:DNA-binding transcriptional MerR regulator
VLLIRRIRELLYEEGFTISGARNRLDDSRANEREDEPVEVTYAITEGDLLAIRAELADISQMLGSALK